MPISPFGTWGAIIGMPDRIASRRALLDIGAAGPLAGMVVALPVLVWGLRHSEIKPLAPHSLLEGQSLLYWAIKRVVLGGPIPEGHDVFLHPAAFAGWAGLFVTMINLIPFGQLDGGHIAYALLGPRQNTIARWVRWALLPLFLSNLASHLLAARAQHFPVDWGWNVASNSAFWLLWFGILGLLSRFGGRDHPPTDPGQPLGVIRTGVAILCLALFVLIFMPAPLVQS
jgi:membrane-associated protease RseP (regulator of RpoE activity)